MYPPATMILAKQPIWSFPLHCACFRGCTICVDTLHYLCRVCFERPLLKGIFYSRNISFYRIDAFQRVIMFDFYFRQKKASTQIMPPSRHMSCTEKRQLSKLDIGAISGNWLNVQKKIKCSTWSFMVFLFLASIKQPKSVLIIHRFYSSYKYQNPYNAANIGRFFVP